MINLLHHRQCDIFISKELKMARIPIVKIAKSSGGVPYSIIGKLGQFEFKRYTDYWFVKGFVPLEIAIKMYDTKVGRENVIVIAKDANPYPNPLSHALPKQKVISQIIRELKLPSIDNDEILRLYSISRISYPRYILKYKIKSKEGLELYASTIKKNGLDQM